LENFIDNLWRAIIIHNFIVFKFQFDEIKQMAIDGVTSCMKIREADENKNQFISLRRSGLA